MNDIPLSFPAVTINLVRRLWVKEKAWLFGGLLLIALYLFAPQQGATSARFVMGNLLNVAPFLLLSVGIAAYVGASDADGLVARAFTGTPGVMIIVAAIAGGFAPFCSCGVIPLIAALLAMGVPLSAVMAFWLASPIMGPSMFALTTGVIGIEFAVAKQSPRWVWACLAAQSSISFHGWAACPTLYVRALGMAAVVGRKYAALGPLYGPFGAMVGGLQNLVARGSKPRCF